MTNTQTEQDALQNMVNALQTDGISLLLGQRFSPQQLNQAFPLTQNLFAQAGYRGPLTFAGYLGKLYALYNPQRHLEEEVQRWLRNRLLEQTTEGTRRKCLFNSANDV